MKIEMQTISTHLPSLETKRKEQLHKSSLWGLRTTRPLLVRRRVLPCSLSAVSLKLGVSSFSITRSGMLLRL